MKTPDSLDLPSQAPRSTAMLRATVASVFLIGSTAMASEPKQTEITTVLMTTSKLSQSPEQLKAEAFAQELKKIDQAKDVAQQKKLWLKLAKAEPGMVIQYLKKTEVAFLMETLDIACETLAEKQPDVFLERALDCTDARLYPAHVMIAAKNASVLKPEAAVEFQDRYADSPEGREILKGAIANIRKKTGRVVLKIPNANSQPKRLSK